MLRPLSAACISLIVLAGCASGKYSGPSTNANSQVTFRASGLQKHAAYPDDRLVVRIFLGKDDQGTKLGAAPILSADRLSLDVKLDQGVEYTIRFTSFESHLGGYSSCDVYVPFTPTKDAYKIDYHTRKTDCDAVITRVDQQGQSSMILAASNVAGGTQSTGKVIRY